jgi:cysteine desulfurase
MMTCLYRLNLKRTIPVKANFNLFNKISRNFCSLTNPLEERLNNSNSSFNISENISVKVEENSKNKKSVFLDFQSTTPLDPRVLDRMMPYFTVMYGNPHSKSHVFGWEADKAVEKAREVYKI